MEEEDDGEVEVEEEEEEEVFSSFTLTKSLKLNNCDSLLLTSRHFI